MNDKIYSAEEFNAFPVGTKLRHRKCDGEVVYTYGQKYVKFGNTMYSCSGDISRYPLNEPMSVIEDDEFALKLINLYIHNAILYSKGIRYGWPQSPAPDEQLMRMIESHAGIDEINVAWWRNQVWEHFIQLRIDLCVKKLTEAINWMLKFPETIERLNKYAAIIPSYTGFEVVHKEDQVEEIQEST